MRYPHSTLHVTIRDASVSLTKVIVPDIVAGGLASLERSAFWRDTVPTEFAAYLAVQDGMTEADVVPELRRYQGIFVGGSLAWKLATAGAQLRPQPLHASQDPGPDARDARQAHPSLGTQTG